MNISQELLDKLIKQVKNLPEDEVKALTIFAERLNEMNTKIHPGVKFSSKLFGDSAEQNDADYKAWKKQNPDIKIICVLLTQHPAKKNNQLMKINFYRKE